MPTKKAAPSSTSATKKEGGQAKKVTKKTTAKKAVKKAPVKKTVSKKAAPKKTVSKRKSDKRSGRVLVCADGASCFWTTDGQILKDLIELRDALEAMADEVFLHHVTKEKNDFADWVESVLEDAECAAALRKSKKSNSARTVVVRHLKQYSL